MITESLFTTHDISRMLQVDPSTVSKWIDRGILLAFRTPGGHRRVRSADLRTFLIAHQMPVPDELGSDVVRLLIVDDEQHIRLLIEQTLEELLDEGVELYTAADGNEALAAIAAQRPDLVFLDVMMPGQSGLDVTRAVRNDPALSGAHIVLLTAKGQAQDQEAGLAAGADQYLTKPFDPDALLALARTVLGPE